MTTEETAHEFEREHRSLICEAATRRYILDYAQRTRPHTGFKRVSKATMVSLDLCLRRIVRRAVQAHRSNTKTLKF